MLSEESSFFIGAGHSFSAVCIRTSMERSEALDKEFILLLRKSKMADKSSEDILNSIRRIDKIYDQLKHRENALKNDYSNLYMSLNISIAFYGAIIVLTAKDIDANGNIFIIYSIMFLLIPMFSYIFGMLYCYNLFAIIKGGYVTTELENRLISLQKAVYGEADYIGWGIVEKEEILVVYWYMVQ